jgi:cytochrome b561
MSRTCFTDGIERKRSRRHAKPAFIILIAIHALAALYHQFWLKDGTLKRMLAPGR